jgi:uncharacterized protein YqeY
MNLKQRITEDMKLAMKARESAKLGAIRLLLAAIKQKEVDERIELTDTDIITVIDKMLKQRRDSISQYEAAQRQDLADQEKFEVAILETYMPQPLSSAEIEAAIAAAFSEHGNTLKSMGKIMATLRPLLAGRADLAQVSALVKSRLV